MQSPPHKAAKRCENRKLDLYSQKQAEKDEFSCRFIFKYQSKKFAQSAIVIQDQSLSAPLTRGQLATISYFCTSLP